MLCYAFFLCLAARMDDDPAAATIGQLALQVVQELTQFINIDNNDNDNDAVTTITTTTGNSGGKSGNGKIKKKSAGF